MRTRAPIAMLAGLVLAATTALTSATPAQADDYCDYEDSTPPTVYGYGPSKVVVGLTPPLVKFHIDADDECGIDGWTISGKHMFAYEKNPSETIYAFFNSDAGRSYADVSAEDPAYNTTTERFSFTLLRRATWKQGSFNVGPEPVRKGQKVTVTGTLLRVDWDANSYKRYGSGSAKVKVQFKKKGSDSYRTVKTVTVGKKGVVRTTVKASGATGKDGTYRLYFGGNGVTSTATTKGDYVDVK